MARKKKKIGCLSMMIGLCFLPIKLIYEAAMSYRPHNSRAAKISRAKKKKWF